MGGEAESTASRHIRPVTHPQWDRSVGLDQSLIEPALPREANMDKMDKNEIARLLQRALNEYEGMRQRAAGGSQSLEMAAHDFATRIGGIIVDIDADTARERNDADERERMTPIAPYWPQHPRNDPYRGGWTPVQLSSHNSLDGE